MATNLEVKIKFNSFADLKTRLEKIAADNMGILSQKDIYFKYNKGLLKLREQDGIFQLIKYNRDEEGHDRWSNYELLTLSGNEVENYLCEILEPECVVEKKRELYLYNNTRVHLDTVNNLGLFLELETLVFDDMQDARIRFQQIIELLNLDLSNQIRKSYRNLLMQA